jgi:hypothetical protein
MVVFRIGLWAMAHPPSLLRLHLKASRGLTPSRIRFFRFRSRFFQWCQIQYRSRFLSQPSSSFNFPWMLPDTFVSGFYFCHPLSFYPIQLIFRDQTRSYFRTILLTCVIILGSDTLSKVPQNSRKSLSKLCTFCRKSRKSLSKVCISFRKSVNSL